MAKKKDIQQCEYYEICDARLHPHSSTDKPNMAAHLGFRCVYVLISWFILSYKIRKKTRLLSEKYKILILLYCTVY